MEYKDFLEFSVKLTQDENGKNCVVISPKSEPNKALYRYSTVNEIGEQFAYGLRNYYDDSITNPPPFE